MNVWDERRLAKRIRMQVKELTALLADTRQYSETLSAVEADGDRADAQRDRGESWGELSDVLESAIQETDGAVDAVESLLL
jgi:hypothetical protein